MYDKVMKWLENLGYAIAATAGVFYGIVMDIAMLQEPHANAPWPVEVLLLSFIFAVTCFLAGFMVLMMVLVCGAVIPAVGVCRKAFSGCGDRLSLTIVMLVYAVATAVAYSGGSWMIEDEAAKFGRVATGDFLVMPIYAATMFFMAVLLQSAPIYAVGAFRMSFASDLKLGSKAA